MKKVALFQVYLKEEMMKISLCTAEKNILK